MICARNMKRERSPIAKPLPYLAASALPADRKPAE